MPDAQTMLASSARFASAADALDWAERTHTRIRVHYGYASDAARDHAIARGLGATPETTPTVGQDWGDVYDVSGTIGRSMGTPGRPETRIRLLIANRTSTGGPGMISPECIVRVRYANREHGGDLYRHPDYLPPNRGDAFPADLARSQRDYARHFAADPADARGCTVDRLTTLLQDAGRSYALRIDGHGDIAIDTPSDDGRITALAIVERDGSGVRYWGDGTPEHFDASGAALSYP
jgi:hypothetical protein